MFVHPEVTVVVVVDCFYRTLFFTLEQAHCSLVTCDSKWETFTYSSALFNVHLSDVLMALFGCYMVNAIWNCHHPGARSVYIIQPCVCLQCYFIPSHIIMCGACVTCHLHFWQNEWDLSCATAVTRGGTDTEMSQHLKLTLEKKIILPLLSGLEPTTFWSRVRCSNHWSIHTAQCGWWGVKIQELLIKIILYCP